MIWGTSLPLEGPVGVPAPPIVPIAAGSMSNVASFDIAWGDQAFEEVNILIDQWTPTGNGMPDIFTSSDNGATFDTGASDYRAQGIAHNPSGAINGYGGTMDSIQVGFDASNAQMLANTATGCFMFTIYRPYDASLRTVVEGWGGYDHNVVSDSMNVQGSGYRDAAGKVNAVRLASTVGNVSARYFAWGALPL